MLKIHFITILLVTSICVPAFAGASGRQSYAAEKEIIKSFAALDRAGKETGGRIGQYFYQIGKQTGKVLKDMARTLKGAAQK